MMEKRIGNLELLDRLDDLVPELLQMRDHIDTVVMEIKMFRSSQAVGVDKTRIKVIAKSIEDYFDVKMFDVRGKSRKGDALKARHIFSALAKSLTGLTLEEIGNEIHRDHTTVLHSIEVIDNAKDTGDQLYTHYQRIKRTVEEMLSQID